MDRMRENTLSQEVIREIECQDLGTFVVERNPQPVRFKMTCQNPSDYKSLYTVVVVCRELWGHSTEFLIRKKTMDVQDPGTIQLREARRRRPRRDPEVETLILENPTPGMCDVFNEEQFVNTDQL